ncbi:MAG: hypothetical protein IJ706_01635, partial [Clostridia bacterium]|nr:hypothetical protein [Clostridia bacterium]
MKRGIVLAAAIASLALCCFGAGCSQGKQEESFTEDEIKMEGHTETEEPSPSDKIEELDGLQNVKRMAYTLLCNKAYSTESYGTENTKVLFISYTQEVWSFNDYNHGVMVSEDIAKSSLVNTATQSCFKGD